MDSSNEFVPIAEKLEGVEENVDIITLIFVNETVGLHANTQEYAKVLSTFLSGNNEIVKLISVLPFS